METRHHTSPGRAALATIATVLKTRQDDLASSGIGRLIVFGSVARGTDQPESDVDIAVFARPGISLSGLKLSAWRGFLTGIIGREVDAVAFEWLRDDVRAAVEAEGVEVFCAD